MGDPSRVLAPFGPSYRAGLLTNDGARVTQSGAGHPGATSREALMGEGVDIVRLFSPEHGLSAQGPDGVAMPHARDPDTGLPVISLYGNTRTPDPEALRELDLILVDLQDVGARFYTYLWTLTHMVEAAAQAGIPVVILDRPNPLGGLEAAVEGPLPQEDFTPTFLGRWPVPIRHSLTLGEMALLLQAEMGLESHVEVLAMEGWDRSMLWRDTGIPFYPPSPGIPSPESALFYPGTALLEATNLLEGRGTSVAFRWFGAPWLDQNRLCKAINEMKAGEVEAHPHHLAIPGSSGDCPGVLLNSGAPEALRPVALGLHLLVLLGTFHPDRFRWTPYPTAVNPKGGNHLSLLLAHGKVEEILQHPEGFNSAMIDEWCRAPGWWDRASPHLLYP